jgi:hypothetical protein
MPQKRQTSAPASYLYSATITMVLLAAVSAMISDQNEESWLEIYSTHDSGATWSLTREVPLGENVGKLTSAHGRKRGGKQTQLN